MTVGGRITPRVGYFLSGGGNRTDRYLDPPTADNFHNSGHAERFTGKLELRPTDADFVRAVVVGRTAAASRRRTAPTPQLAGVDTTQELHGQLADDHLAASARRHATLDVVAYRRAATATLDASNAIPLAATQDRSLDHQGVERGGQRDQRPASIQGRRAVRPQPGGRALPHDRHAARIPTAPFIRFDGRRSLRGTGQNLGLFVQDTFSPIDDLHINVGVRYDRYKLLIEDTRGQPARRRRLSRARLGHGAARLLQPHLHAAVLGEPAALELAGGARAVAEPRRRAATTCSRSGSMPTKSAFSRRSARARSSIVAYYRKDIRNLADVDQFLDTTVTFPLSVAKGLAQGVEARLDVPLHRGVSGYVSLSRAKILLTAPLTGGLFLGEVPPRGRAVLRRSRPAVAVAVRRRSSIPSRRVFGSVSGRYDSGIPFEMPARTSIRRRSRIRWR